MFIAQEHGKGWVVYDFIVDGKTIKYIPSSIEFNTQQEAVKCMETIKRITGIL